MVDKFNVYGFKSQTELFEYKWNNSVHKCFLTGRSLNKYKGTSYYKNLFAHVLRKSAFPEFRLYANNIVLLLPEAHTCFDNANIKEILEFEQEYKCDFSVLFELEQDIYGEYVLEFGKKTPMRKIVEAYFSLSR